MATIRESYPPGTPCFVDTMQPDVAAAQDFYGAIFGWEFDERGPGYFVARVPDGDVAGMGPGDAARWNTYVSVDDIEAGTARAEAAGGTTALAPQAFGDVGRFAYVTDPAGALIGLWQPLGYAGSQVVNAPGSWNWSNLHADDVETAMGFYGPVFGWEARAVELAPGVSGTMLMLPAYGDHLELRDPGVRERHAGAGAPEGFTDAIGWIEPLADGAAPHWHVTLSAADTDATVARAAELGGEVLVPPFDARPVRMATLRDPQGAAFSVNTYAPV